MAASERLQRTPENDEGLLAKLERINQDENPIERTRKLDQFYEEMDALNDPDSDCTSSEPLRH